MNQIKQLTTMEYKLYPFEFVLSRKGSYIMSSFSCDELSRNHFTTHGIHFKDFLQINGYAIKSNESGSYTIYVKNFCKSDIEKKEASIQFAKLKIQYNGRLMTFMNIMRMKGYSHSQSQTIRSRISRGWDPIEAIDEPIRDISHSAINIIP